MNQANRKTVMITGASAGVGAACAKRFASDGVNLVLIARGKDGLHRIENELSPTCEVLTVAMDVARFEEYDRLFQLVEDRFGRIDVLINNAGMHARGEFESLHMSEVAAMVDVNLKAPLMFSRMVIPWMKQSQGGAIIMVGSLAGRAPLQGAATYSSTKAALRAFTYALADELKDDPVQVGIVSPGPIDTGFIMSHIDEVEDIVFSQPMSSAEEVADAVYSLAAGTQTEITMPAISGLLTTLGYLFPTLRRSIRPLLVNKGRRNKQKYTRRKTREP